MYMKNNMKTIMFRCMFIINIIKLCDKILLKIKKRTVVQSWT